MPQYLLSVHTDDRQSSPPTSDEQMRKGYEKVARLEAEMTAAGALVFSGRLDAPASARVVRTSNGKMLTTDGPFVEAKEQIGGFYIVEATNLDDALGWASKTSAAIDMPIEVRPFWRPPER